MGREREKQTDRQTDMEREREREKEGGRDREREGANRGRECVHARSHRLRVRAVSCSSYPRVQHDLHQLRSRARGMLQVLVRLLRVHDLHCGCVGWQLAVQAGLPRVRRSDVQHCNNGSGASAECRRAPTQKTAKRA